MTLGSGPAVLLEPASERPRSAVYTGAAFAVVFRVDASGVVAAAIRISRNHRICAARRTLELPGESFGHAPR